MGKKYPGRRSAETEEPAPGAEPPAEAPEAVTEVPTPDADDERQQDAARAAIEIMRRFSIPG